MELSVPIPTLFVEESHQPKDLIFESERTAIHSGRLGDIIYALPTCRALGINHLILNVSAVEKDPRRIMTFKSTQQIIPLLLAQSYLKKVSIAQCNFRLEEFNEPLPNVDYNLDHFRNVVRHRVGYQLARLQPRIRFLSPDQYPVHLAQIFAASQGVQVTLEEPWLEVEPSALSKGSVVISITHNWRTYPNWYWKTLLQGLRNVLFVGLESEWKRVNLPSAKFIPTQDHRELAAIIAGAQLFLGTISFPYAIAEGLKVNRAVELCHTELDAFPVTPNGCVLPVDVMDARELIATLLEEGQSDFLYTRITRQLRRVPGLWVKRTFLLFRVFGTLIAQKIYSWIRQQITRIKYNASPVDSG